MKTGLSVGDPRDLRSLATALTGVEQSNHLERAAHAPEQEALWCVREPMLTIPAHSP